MFAGKLNILSALALLLVATEAKNSLMKNSSSSSSSNSTTRSSSSSGSSSSSSRSGRYYTESSSKSSSSSSRSGSDSSSGTEPEVLTGCRRKDQVHLVINEPFTKKLARTAKYLDKKNVSASFVVNGYDLIDSNNYKSANYRRFIKTLSSSKTSDGAAKPVHNIVIKPNLTKEIKLLTPKELLHAVTASATGIATVLQTNKSHVQHYQPVLVHLPGGKVDKKQAKLLNKYGYTILHWNKTMDSHGKGLKSFRRKSRSKKRKSSSSSSSSSSTDSSSSSSSSSWSNEISSRSSSSRTSSSSSSGSGSSSSSRCHGRRRRHRRRQHKVRGHIVYGRHGHHLGRHVQKTVENLRHKKYSIVDIKTCTNKRAYRPVDLTDVAFLNY